MNFACIVLGAIFRGRPKRGGGEGFEKSGQTWTLKEGKGRGLRTLDV